MSERIRVRFTRTGSGVIANVSRTGERWFVTAQVLPDMAAAELAAQAMVQEAMAADAARSSSAAHRAACAVPWGRL